MKDDCIFCKLANGVFPTNMVYEDQDFAAFLDASPAAKGHTLLVPKQHAANVYELPDDVASRVFPTLKKLAARMKDVLHCDGINILQNNGPAAGQTVFHFHVHIIPRYDGDEAILEWKHLEPTEEEQKNICEKIKVQ